MADQQRRYYCIFFLHGWSTKKILLHCLLAWLINKEDTTALFSCMVDQQRLGDFISNEKNLGNSSCPKLQQVSLYKRATPKIPFLKNDLDEDLCIKPAHLHMKWKVFAIFDFLIFFQVWYFIAEMVYVIVNESIKACIIYLWRSLRIFK